MPDIFRFDPISPDFGRYCLFWLRGPATGDISRAFFKQWHSNQTSSNLISKSICPSFIVMASANFGGHSVGRFTTAGAPSVDNRTDVRGASPTPSKSAARSPTVEVIEFGSQAANPAASTDVRRYRGNRRGWMRPPDCQPVEGRRSAVWPSHLTRHASKIDTIWRSVRAGFGLIWREKLSVYQPPQPN